MGFIRQKTVFSEKMVQRTVYVRILRRVCRHPCYNDNIVSLCDRILAQTVTFADKPGNSAPYDAFTDLFAYGNTEPVYIFSVFNYIHYKVAVRQRFPPVIYVSELKVLSE